MNRFVLGAAAGLALAAFAAPANAADLGGDCCADLEERVAELEATTARKGNRKVSLKVYGHINRAVMFWDDGTEDNVYVVDNDHSSSRFGFKGKAKINGEWSAGYKIEIETETGVSSSAVTQATDDPGGSSLSVRKSEMYIKSKRLGGLTWGLTSGATDDITYKGQVSGTVSYSQADFHYVRAFKLASDIDVGDLCGDAFDSDGCFDSTSRKDAIRYDSPKVAGFQLKAAWGEDDFWDIALLTKQKFGDFKFAATVGYRDVNDTKLDDTSEDSIRGGAGLMHKPSGIFVEGSYFWNEIDSSNASVDGLESDGWWIQAGLQRKWNSLGKTTIWGEYAEANDGVVGECLDNGGKFGSDDNIDCGDNISSELTRWGVGMSQKIDAAALELYVLYQHTEADISVAGDALDLDADEIDMVVMGGKIKF